MPNDEPDSPLMIIYILQHGEPFTCDLGNEAANLKAASPTATHWPGVETRLKILNLRGKLGGEGVQQTKKLRKILINECKKS